VIIGSILFVLVAAGLFVAGVLQGDEVYYYLSIVASAIAALALVVGVRTMAAGRSDDDFDAPPPGQRRPGPAVGRAAAPKQLGSRAEAPGTELEVRADPPDEPPAQYVTPIEAARLAKVRASVVVIDGRPRYHIIECAHLLGREHEALPVREAIELGFTPCGACEPATVLLAGLLHP